MDFRHLRAFITVAEEASVTRAAERLHISQPPLSRHIKQLEDELGITLFIRHRQGVTLTNAGQHLLEKARALASAASDFYESANQATRHGANKVRLGIGWGLWDTVNRIRVTSAAQFGNLTIEATDVMCAEQYNNQLRDGSLDVVFGRPYFDAEITDSVPLYHERMLAVLSEDSPLAARKTLGVRDLASEPLLLYDRHLSPYIYDKVLEVYAKAGVTPRMVPTPDAGPHNQAGLMMVASGKGIYVCMGIPLTSPRPLSGIAVVPISDPDATIDICVAWRKGETSAVVRQFLNCVWQVFPEAERVPVAVKTASRRAS
jgi:DNA-binding transcriptional LysR family regulator